MKRQRGLLALLLAFTLVFSNAGMVFAKGENDIKLVIDNQLVDSKVLSENSRTLLPMRKVFELLGAEVKWNATKKEVTGIKGDREVRLTIGSSIGWINGEKVQLDVAAKLVDSLTYVPIRFVGEALGSEVDWDHATRTVLIDSDKDRLGEILKDKPTSSQDRFSEENVLNSILPLMEKYPNWTRWDNSYKYSWDAGIWNAGYGCVGFAFMLSDAAFEGMPARKTTDFDNIRVGDIVRINGNSHSVLVLGIDGDEIITAEGNVAGMVLWGLSYPLEDFKKAANYVITRYPK